MLSKADTSILVFILALRSLPGVGNKTIQKLFSEKKDLIENAPRFDFEFIKALGIQKVNAALETIEFDGWGRLKNEAANTLAVAESAGIKMLHPLMDDYPQRLLKNKSFPPLLFYRGNSEALNTEKAVAIVGTRNPTETGKRWARRLAGLLAEDDYVIISGLAIGSDTMGHEGALEAHGKTVAVLPLPLDMPVYPRNNRELAERILENDGALVSEYPPGKKISDRQLISNLVARDEWQPGLADGIIAVETSQDGGTRHALKHAEKTNTPIAVFDYSFISDIDFTDSHFGGNVSYLQSEKASGIHDTSSIEAFKDRMNTYRNSCNTEQAQLPLL